MHAIQVANEGQTLAWQQVSDPDFQDHEVLLSVKAAGVNRADILQSKGLYPPPQGASEILGLELAGVVEFVGKAVKSRQPGDPVMALVPGGAYAEKAVVPESMLLPIPKDWSYEKAAALPEALYTAYLNLMIEGNLKPHERVLIHSAAGGIGSIAIQLAKWQEAEVAACTGSADKLEFCKQLGADHGLNRKSSPLKDQLHEIWPEGCRLVLDTIGNSEYAELHTKMLAHKGRWLLIGLLGGTKAEINMARVLSKNLMLKGSTLRNKPLSEKSTITQSIKNEVWPAIEQGLIVPVLDQVFPISEAKAAHEYMAENQVMGKVVLKVE